jgi:NAD(P)H dehydrogenase (quinone)
MRFFIVHAHHEPSSFSGALTREALSVLPRSGHEVVVSDLHAMNFDPVSDRRNFTSVKDPTRLKQQAEEEFASANDAFVPELQAEIDKLFWCDALILQFPLWWLGLPAILKGWVDRVFALGRAYGGGRYFERGVFAGKSAMCSLTVGGPAAAYSDVGVYGPMSAILYPIHHGILSFVGFAVAEPFAVYAPARMSVDERLVAIQRYGERLLALHSVPTLPGPRIDEYEGLVLKAVAQQGAAPDPRKERGDR